MRYMDDFVLFANDKNTLWQAKIGVTDFLQNQLKLKMHEAKCRIYKTENGTPFLGQLIFPMHRRLKRENIIRCKRKLRRQQKQHEEGKINWESIRQSVQAWLGHAKNADTFKIRGLVLEDVIFRSGGHVIDLGDSAGRFLEQQ